MGTSKTFDKNVGCREWLRLNPVLADGGCQQTRDVLIRFMAIFFKSFHVRASIWSLFLSYSSAASL